MSPPPPCCCAVISYILLLTHSVPAISSSNYFLNNSSILSPRGPLSQKQLPQALLWLTHYLKTLLRCHIFKEASFNHLMDFAIPSLSSSPHPPRPSLLAGTLIPQQHFSSFNNHMMDLCSPFTVYFTYWDQHRNFFFFFGLFCFLT